MFVRQDGDERRNGKWDKRDVNLYCPILCQNIEVNQVPPSCVPGGSHTDFVAIGSDLFRQLERGHLHSTLDSHSLQSLCDIIFMHCGVSDQYIDDYAH